MLRLETYSSLLLRNKIESFLDRIVICDEKWILYYNRKRTGQWLDKNEDPKQFPKPQLTVKKLLVTVWWSSKKLLYYEFMKPGESINFEVCCQLLDKIHQKLSQK
ncbi:Histone-lysine N-methyltransferase SETMAR [Strongyloides ratti]|uniref:Histone-lysine N-methyltransferase SETMAR n=1 Tax=Strongyloides ratti TaxID=34506 RepID=A0A090KSG7_STRRB|nr:Histone-lysine N-methyltransferase SETMAR [Strongyloides ratti]CEF60351.1 Histone-lysine N-methyltransferase SETMAR [Strongyloides ratti]